jgi:hypothetical protein
MAIPQVSLVLHEPDSGKVLRRALEAYRDFLQHAAASADTNATNLAKAGGKLADEASRAQRRAAEFQRRQALAQQLVDQLPDTGAALPVPKGNL